MLTFDEASHVYRWKGEVRPSVTQILDRLHDFARVPVEVLNTAKKRGSAVHLITQLHDENDLDPSTVDDCYAGYFLAWQLFCAQHQPAWVAIEESEYDDTWKIAGTPDRFATVTYEGKRVLAQVDIKTSVQAHPCWGLQTAAYNKIAKREEALRLTCQLRSDGTYKLLPWRDRSDLAVFLSLINLNNWTRKHGL